MTRLKSAVLVLALGLIVNAFADEVSADDAARAVGAWAKAGATLGARLGTSVGATAAHVTTDGVRYYSVKLREGGTVFTSADTEMEPIVAFTASPDDFSTIDKASPLWALLERDFAVRQAMKAAGTQSGPSFATASAGASRKSKTARKWAALLASKEGAKGPSFGMGAAGTPPNSVSSLSDVRVDKLLRTKWGQTNVGVNYPDGTGEYVNIGYNYATPMSELAPGISYHCVPGCTAVSVAQLMYYHKFPTDDLPPRTYRCVVDDVPTDLTTHGGRFDWANMIEEVTPDNAKSVTELNRQALGYLMSDIGIALKSDYSVLLTIALPYDDELALKETFGYRQAFTFFDNTSANEAYNGSGYVTGKRGLYNDAVKAKIVYANLDAGLPVLLGIYGYPSGYIGNKNSWSGHAVVGDGYGFNTVDDVTTAYVHINLGWSGQDDTWYNIPEIDTNSTGSSAGSGKTDYTVMAGVVYNVFPDKTGLILSGRVTDSDGKGLSGMTVRARSGNALAGETQTNEKGIYALVLPAGTYDVETAVGDVTAGLSAPVTLLDPTTTYYSSAGRAIVMAENEVGNSWGNDIVWTAPPEPEEPEEPEDPDVPSEYGYLWFDAGIAKYRTWPTDGSDCEIEGVGSWSGTTYAELVGADKAKYLNLFVPADHRVEFQVGSHKPVSPDIVTVRTSVRMPIFDSAADLPMESAKCALAGVLVDDAPVYFGFALDPAGETNAWRRLSGAVPNAESVSELVFDLKKENGVGLVRYSVDGQVLKDGEDEWIAIALDGGTVAGDVSAVSYRGDGEVSVLAGYTENAASTIALTIPEIEHMTVASVLANGVLVEPKDGTWRVPQGALVVVRFDPEEGYVLASPRMKFLAGNEDMALPDVGRPTAILVSSCLSINEIMASNGTTLSTRNGTTGIDWVELYNSGDEDIDLAGWYLGNDPTKKPSKWSDFAIRGSCVVPAKGYKIVWCDGDKACADGDYAADEPFVRCNISTTAGKHTVFLSSKADADGIVEQITMPGQMKDVSYGFGQLERTLLAENGAAQYRVGEGEWTEVKGPVGMSSAATSFTVTTYQSKSAIASIDAAEALLSDESKWLADPIRATDVGSVAYRNTASAGDFAPSCYTAFPGTPGNMVVVVEGTVTVPRTGLWTFSVGADDGFRLTLSDAANSYTVESPNVGSYGQTYSAFSMEAGSYNLRLVYFDQSGDAVLDMSVAEGDYTVDETSFSTDVFTLVGAAGCPVGHGGALAGYLAADLGSEMLGKTDAFEWKSSFILNELPEANDRVRLRIRYADGFTARVNGTTVAAVEAESARSAAEALEYATFDIDHAVLKLGENELEITVVNDDASDSEAFLSAQVVAESGNGEFVYFREPTPGRANVTHGYGPMTPEVRFSEPHGYKTEPFELTLSCEEAPYSPIYYTLDGTSPTERSTRYTGPITVSKTACVRAAVPTENTILQYDCAATYIFLEDVLENQKSGVVPEGFPADKEINNHALRYGMSEKAMDADPERLRRGFENISTFSIVIDPKNLFDKASGIYVNPSGDGKSWERQMMLEQINPNGDAGFSVPAGIRIRGAASRGTDRAKHSLRFFFRGEYGMGSLEYPLFGEEGTDEFDKVDLRTSQNYSWANEGSNKDTFIHECFSRDTQGAMGEHYTRSRYYHLFINGQYWGLYQTEERGDEDFAEAYNGGASGNYDVIKTSYKGGGVYHTGPSEGTDEAWKSLWDLIVHQSDGPQNFRRAMGLNEDGSRNPDYPVYLNPTNLIVYMLIAHYVNDSDAPISLSGFPNNLYALRDRADGDSKSDGFFFLRHDAEHSLGVRNGFGVDYDSTILGTDFTPAPAAYPSCCGPSFLNYDNKFSPAELFWKLGQNGEFRRMIADLFYRHCLKAGGALTAPVAKARFEKRMAEISDAVVAEAARWSKNPNAPMSHTTWENACAGCLDFIDGRLVHMKAQYQARGWYPRTDPATAVDADGQPLADGATVGAREAVYLTNPSAGRVYYTTDGSDPALADGSLAPGALLYEDGIAVPPEGLALRMRVLSSDGQEWSAMDSVTLCGEEPEYPEVIEDVVETNEEIRAWIELLYATEEGRAAIDGFTGDAATLRDCYLVDILPEAEPEIEVRIPSVAIGADGKVRVGGELSVHGTERAATVNGTIRLYHATELDALPTTTDAVDLGHEFPIPDEKGTVDLDPAPVRFLRLKIE